VSQLLVAQGAPVDRVDRAMGLHAMVEDDEEMEEDDGDGDGDA